MQTQDTAHFSIILKNKEIIARDGKMNLFETKELFMAQNELLKCKNNEKNDLMLKFME